MRTYKIERGIKIPPVSHAGSNGEASLVAATIQVLKAGESFLVKIPLEAAKAGKVMRDFMARERKNKGKRVFVSRKLAAGVRIWRLK